MAETISNPLRRCSLCKGREILVFENEQVIDSSLVDDGTKFFCKNQGECKRNIQAEAMSIEMGMDSEGNLHPTGLNMKDKLGNEVIHIEKT